jgi:outer membrane protein OmpA-like peptidoglycan-associated protein/Tol biopolymer transport system component
MKKYILLFLVAFSIQIAFAQKYDASKVSKKAVAFYEKAMAEADEGRYEDALIQLNEALKVYPSYVDAMLSQAGILGELKRYSESVQAYERAFAADPEYAKEYYLPYAINLTGKGDFEKGLEAVEIFLKQPRLNESSIKSGEYRKRNLLFAIAYKKSSSYDEKIKIEGVGDGVNSTTSEYFPSLTIDGKKLIFTKRVGNNEDFYSSEKVGEQWSASAPLTGAINTPLNEGGQQISQDGKWLVYAGCNFPDSYGGCDIYISYNISGAWGPRENLGKSINSEFWESTPCLSPDKSDLYFSSNRSGGFGGSDIYVSHKMANGKWTVAENLGSTINTSADESFPFMHADGETLYFTSDGLQGYGGSDIFLTKKKLTGFDIPLNIGFPINTVNNEGSMVVNAEGQVAYYASDRSEGKGGLDIYSFVLRDGIRPVETSWVQGKVYDQNTKTGLQATVELVDIKSGRMVSQVETDNEGNYLTILPKGRVYAFNVNKKGSLFFSSQFNTEEGNDGKSKVVDVPLQSINVGANIILKNIFFNSAKYDLLPESILELKRLVLLMNENPTIKIQINGYTDNIGKDADNKLLSEARAKSVVAYLNTQGIPINRLLFKGFGATNPISSNETEDGRALNRRTEMVIVSK